MKGLIVAVAVLMAPLGMAAAQQAAPPLNAEAASEMGYRRVVLAGQSAGAWVSLAALARGAPVDGVVSIAAAHHGEVIKMRGDTTRARSEWQNVIGALRPGARVVLVNFAEDGYDVGGRMDDARSAFAKSGVNAVVIDNPEGFKGHGAAGDLVFARKFGGCIETFVDKGTRQAPALLGFSPERGPPGPLMIIVFAGSAPLQWRVFC